MTRTPLSRRTFASLGVGLAMGVVGCADVELHGPEVRDPWDPDFPGARNRDFSAQAAFSMQLDGSVVSALSVVGIAGTVEIVGGEGSEISIEGVRRVRSDSQSDAERSLDGLEVEVFQSAATLHVNSRQPRWTHGRAYEVDYRLTIPDHLDLFVELVAGEILASATLADNGVIDFANVAGNIELEIPSATSASLRAEVVSGSIHVENLALDDQDPRAGVVRGTLGSGGGSIALSTVAGDVTVTGR